MSRWRAFWLVLLALLAAPAAAQSIVERLISPGALSAPHARLEARCDACHTSFRKVAQSGQCLACHKPVAADIAGGTGLHGKWAPAHGECRTCHAEHKGRGTPLVRLDRNSFNHGLTDFALTGAHVRTACNGCHQPGAAFRAAPRTCNGCHARRDPHRGQLGAACQNCHLTTAWKPIQPFNHAATGFALTGQHRQVSCLTCHAGQRWQGLASNCVSCHARDDAHRGSRGTNCAQCHSTAGWKAATFDHAGTGFPLLGAHAAASCAACHGVANARPSPAKACNGCHAKDDRHKGGNGSDCAQCHTSRTWKQIAFDHDRLTRFPLRGAHRDALCAACHAQPLRAAKPAATCAACHAKDDRHKGANGSDCQRCHTESAWKIASFDHDRMTRFPLAGKHAKVPCEQCHGKPGAEVRPAVTCGSCHARDDVHGGRLGSSCANCHDAASWKERVRFDHALTRFPLLGRHVALACTACHVDRGFAAKGLGCADCHVDDHHKGGLGKPAACGTCHMASSWKNWRFDHDTATRFPLTGRHAGLICAACHGRAGDPRQLSRQCVDCHRRDDPHRGGFGEDCERCHVTEDFRQVRFDKPR
ncbi:MAG: cytochrome C [Sphingomonadales bacterium]|nr:cytochrome C [Sphingomonadales bacterium]